ncbi:MAG: histidine phosphatase family protein [Patescibacteria group bacterium]|nr:histidine phosphatase family protein [Patescibacteria group bacterium]
MAKLILLRHLKSQWNLENRFTGWVDVPLAKDNINKTKAISKTIFKFKIDKIYSSPLFRNQESVLKILNYTKKYPIFTYLDNNKMNKWGNFKEINKNYFPVYISESLNERYYGKLQGEKKKDIMKKYGKEKTHLWRRGFENNPPNGESLSDTFKRTIPFYCKYIEKDINQGKNVLIVASHNALRSLVKYIEKIPDRHIINVEIPYAGIIKYEFYDSLKLKNKKIL